MRRPVAAWCLAGYLAILLGLTLGGFYQPRAPVNLCPLRSIVHDLRAGGRHLVVNFLGNVVAFLPMGVLVPPLVGGRRPIRAVLHWSFALSLSIEVLQGLTGRRVADVDDVILNTLGALIGHVLSRAKIGRPPANNPSGEGNASTGDQAERPPMEDSTGRNPVARPARCRVLLGTRGLLVAAGLVALILGWLVHVDRRAARQQALIAELARLRIYPRGNEPTGMSLIVKKFLPGREAGLRDRIGPGWFDRPTIFFGNFRDDQIAEVAERLRALETVREVHYGGPRLTEEGAFRLRAALPGVNVVPNSKPETHRYFLGSMGEHFAYQAAAFAATIALIALVAFAYLARWFFRRLRVIACDWRDVGPGPDEPGVFEPTTGVQEA